MLLDLDLDKLFYQDARISILELVSMLVLKILILNLINYLTKLLKNIMVIRLRTPM